MRKKGYADLAAMRDRIQALVREELGDDVRVSIEISDPPRREVAVSVVSTEMDAPQFAEYRGAPWQEN